MSGMVKFAHFYPIFSGKNTEAVKSIVTKQIAELNKIYANEPFGKYKVQFEKARDFEVIDLFLYLIFTFFMCTRTAIPKTPFATLLAK